MKLKIKQNKIKAGIGIVERISIKSSSLPVLKNILMKVEKNFINFTATDLETGVQWWSLAKTEKEGEGVFPANILSGFVNFLPDEEVSLSSQKNDLSISCGHFETQIKGFNPEDFPIIPEVTEKASISVDSNVLCSGLSQVADIPSFSTARPEISGIFFILQKNKMKIVATDSYRLGEKTVDLNESPKEGKFSFILPQKAAKEIIGIFGEREGEIKIVFGSNQVLFEMPMLEKVSHPQIRLVSRLVDGDYPNYEEIIPQKSETVATLNRAEFLNQIKASSIFGGKTNEVKIKVLPEKKGIEVSSESVETGEFKSFIPAKVEGKKGEVSFNYKFLIDGLSSIKLPEIVFEINGTSNPGVLKPAKGSDFLYVVMPIKAN